MTLQKKDSKTITNAFKNTPRNTEMEKHTILLLHHFNHIANLLIDTLIEIHKHIVELRKRQMGQAFLFSSLDTNIKKHQICAVMPKK